MNYAQLIDPEMVREGRHHRVHIHEKTDAPRTPRATR